MKDDNKKPANTEAQKPVNTEVTESKEETQKSANTEAQSENETQKIAELEQKISELEEKWKRSAADYQNQRKWIEEQRSEWIRSANKDILLRILPILDTLVLAQQHSQDANLKVSVGQFVDILNSEGVTTIETVGKEFDPHLMEAVTTGEGDENKVVGELRAGYMLHDKVLRPAQVVVGKAKN